MPFFHDRVEIADKAARITRDGYLVADALVGRANNIQEYRAAELGLTDRKPDEVVRVFRPEKVVFSKDALATLAHRPITIDHPSDRVTAENWRELSVGDVGGDIVRDGEFIRVPVKVMDAGGVKAVQTTHREFSLGYSASLDMTPGEYQGEAYDCALSDASYNHLAACRSARGGSDLRIVDERPDDRRKPANEAPVSSNPSGHDGPQNPLGDAEMPHTLIIDGLQVPDVSDAAKAAIEKLQGQVRDGATALSDAQTQVATLTTDKATLDAKVTTLEKQLADSKLSPQQLRDAAKAYQGTVDKAKALGVAVGDDMDEPAIMKAVVSAKVGDAAKDWNDTQIAASFATLTSDVQAPVSDSLRTVINSGVATIGDVRAVRDAHRASRYN
jgi:hypothetical protein